MKGDFNFRTDSPSSEAKSEQVSDMVDQVRTQLSRSQRRLERIEHNYESLAHYIRVIGVLTGVVILGCAVLAWFEIPIVSGQHALIEELSSLMANAQPSTTPPTATMPPASPAGPSSPLPVPAPVNPPPQIDVKPAPVRANPDKPGVRPAQRVDGPRIDFHVEKNQTEQVAPGIYLTIKATDVDHQQVNGWLQTARNGSIVWIRDQGTESYFRFVSPPDAHPSVLVFTRVDNRGVGGYVMIGNKAGATAEE